MEAEKLFHVSPFLDRQGHYRFRFGLCEDKVSIFIDLFDQSKSKQVVTSLIGDLKPLGAVKNREALSKYSLSTFSALILIHWQALKLFVKGAQFFTKPKQKSEKLTENSPRQKRKAAA